MHRTVAALRVFQRLSNPPQKRARVCVFISVLKMRYLSWGSPWSCKSGGGFEARSAGLRMLPLDTVSRHRRKNFVWAMHPPNGHLVYDVAPPSIWPMGVFLPWCIFQATRNVPDKGTQREIWESNVLGGKQRRKYAGVGVGAESFGLLREGSRACGGKKETAEELEPSELTVEGAKLRENALEAAVRPPHCFNPNNLF